MKKSAYLVITIMTAVLVCGCAAKQAAAPETAPTENQETVHEIAAEEVTTEAPAENQSVTIDRFVGEWGAERTVYTIEKKSDDTAEVSYQGSFSAREGREGSGIGTLKDGVLYVDMEYSNYIYPSDGSDPAKMVIGKSTEVFTPAEAIPDDYDCLEGEVFFVNRYVNVTPDRMELYIRSEIDKPEEYIHLKSGLMNNNGLASEYLVWYSDQIVLGEEDIMWMNKDELKVAKSEILARHGVKFDSQDLQERFDNCSWYKGSVEEDKFDNSELSDIEKTNIRVIEECEKAE